jgi:chemotaxis protein methyltransferase CheR
LRARLRIWSAACSTGQEVYTTRIIIDQMPTLAGWDVTLHGSDLSTEALDKARAGVYSGLEVNRGLPVPLLVRYFDREGLSYRANERLRRMVTWSQVNLIEPLPTTSLWDVVFVRNVLIYFDAPTKRRVLEAVRRVIAPGGFLILGGAETTLGLVDCFAPVQVGATTVYRAEAP